MKIVTVVGARPQFIKASALSRAISIIENLNEVLVHTGQHYDESMSGVFFSELDMPRPDYSLGVGSGAHGSQTGRMMEQIELVLTKEAPECVVVYGDTNSTLAGAIAAAKMHIPVAHIEAGLRSRNRKMPEEINRVLTDHASDLLFTPTHQAASNLANEGISRSQIFNVGDVMYDTTCHFTALAKGRGAILDQVGVQPNAYILATVHRAENTDDPTNLTNIMTALTDLAHELPVVLPLHPRTEKALIDIGLLDQVKRDIHVTPPLGYLDMMALEMNARLIATDSGGVQKEAYFLGIPCITLRRETEWVELVTAGWNQLAPPTSAPQIAGIVRACLANSAPMSRREEIYGNGRAANAIVAVLEERLR